MKRNIGICNRKKRIGRTDRNNVRKDGIDMLFFGKMFPVIKGIDRDVVFKTTGFDRKTATVVGVRYRTEEHCTSVWGHKRGR